MADYSRSCEEYIATQEQEDHERAFFDSADWALCKQGAGVNQKSTVAIETLQPKLQRTPHQQLPPRRPACNSGRDSLFKISYPHPYTLSFSLISLFAPNLSLFLCYVILSSAMLFSAAQRKAFVEGEGDANRSGVKHLEDSNCDNTDVVEKRVFHYNKNIL
ncbi:hypothetical protein HYC85_019157 [Camellia sinensis]|uniref:Uncharacterized protein n=1 Tax=Camellia sinensis TaxID=4442 RepID=A0A7J7GMP8_CAMSI|nr:hypothetical protein HYC85_019157 [Camellia sinensis]